MAVSGKTAAPHEIPYYLGTDKPPDMAAVTKAMADRLHLRLPTAGLVQASASLGLTGSYQDVAGTTLEITPAVASILKVTAAFEFRAGEVTGVYEGTMRLDAADQTPTACIGVTNVAPSKIVVCQVYLLALTAAAHTIKMRAKRTSGASGGTLGGEGNTRYLYELVAS